MCGTQHHTAVSEFFLFLSAVREQTYLTSHISLFVPAGGASGCGLAVMTVTCTIM